MWHKTSKATTLFRQLIYVPRGKRLYPLHFSFLRLCPCVVMLNNFCLQHEKFPWVMYRTSCSCSFRGTCILLKRYIYASVESVIKIILHNVVYLKGTKMKNPSSERQLPVVPLRSSKLLFIKMSSFECILFPPLIPTFLLSVFFFQQMMLR